MLIDYTFLPHISGIVSTVIMLALLEDVFQTKALKLSFTNSCKRLLSNFYASDEQNLPIGPQVAFLPQQCDPPYNFRNREEKIQNSTKYYFTRLHTKTLLRNTLYY